MMMSFKSTKLLHIVTGIIIGFILTSQFRTINYESFKKDILFQLCSNHRKPNVESLSEAIDDDVTNAFWSLKNLSASLANDQRTRLLLVGVMTASQFIDTRAATIYQTWARELDGDIIFFTSSNTKIDRNQSLPLVALPGVDDSYPPQKKSFLMLKFLHDYFGDRYKFFMRADDDVFVNVGRLRALLTQLNSSEPLYFGQTGVGNTEEFGQLSLHFNENFCMGGPGAIVSHRTLTSLAPNIRYCLKNLHSTHEDVEVGRCIRKFAGVSCTWSYDMQSIFYHNATLQETIKRGVFPSSELFNAITIHPIKDQIAMVRLYLYSKQIEYQQLRHKLTQLYRIINANLQADPLLANQSLLLDKAQHLGFGLSFEWLNSLASQEETWKLFTSKLYSESTLNPRSNLNPHLIQAFNDNLQRITAAINKHSIRKGRLLTFKGLHYAYVKFEPQIGVRYILDMMMIYRKFSGKRVTFPVRRHAYAVQTFSETQIRELPLEDLITRVVNIVVPLVGRLTTFQRFIENLINVHWHDKLITFTVILFPESDQLAAITRIKSIVADLRLHNSIDTNVLELKGKFSRARALQASVDTFTNDSLLFFLDVDMFFTPQVLYRVRVNTRQGEAVYFPIVFSQYQNHDNQSYTTSNQRINERNGYWRLFGFGIMSIYKADLLEVGGFNTTIIGWGMEDVNLYDRLVVSNLEVVRVVEPDLVHIYHTIHCDVGLPLVQYEMCLGTKLSSMKSIEVLADHINSLGLLPQPNATFKIDHK